MLFVLAEKIRVMNANYHDTIAYEKSPYFLRKIDEQNRLLKIWGIELEYENQRLIHLYEKLVGNGQIGSTDSKELMRYLARTRIVFRNTYRT